MVHGSIYSTLSVDGPAAGCAFVLLVIFILRKYWKSTTLRQTTVESKRQPLSDESRAKHSPRSVTLECIESGHCCDGDTDIDIIAVHGFDTQAPETWTWRGRDGKNINWLEHPEMLPKLARSEKARILWCNWPADLLEHPDYVAKTIDEIARLLLQGIVARGGRRDRPILFIASCLGGVVLMKALTMAKEEEEEFANIGQSTKGIVFLATPFRGTAFQAVATWTVPNLRLYALFKHQALSKLLAFVEGPTYDLHNLVRGFTRCAKAQHHDWKIHCFYEKGVTRLWRKVFNYPRWWDKFLPAEPVRRTDRLGRDRVGHMTNSRAFQKNTMPHTDPQ